MRGLGFRVAHVSVPIPVFSSLTKAPSPRCDVLPPRLKNMGYTAAITLAGIVACWSVSMVISVVEMITLDQLFPGMLSRGAVANTSGRLALRLAGCLGLMGGGYVTAWLANKVQRSGLKHAVLVGCIYGALGILSDYDHPTSWGLTYVVFMIAVIAPSLGAWMCETRFRYRRTLQTASRRPPRSQSLPLNGLNESWRTGTFHGLQSVGPTRQSRTKLVSR
jgi:hypothetical protein